MFMKKLKKFLCGYHQAVIQCPSCGSLNIKFSNPMVKGNIEKYKVSCRNCGAGGRIKETWSKE